jgi:hypothetical protein
MFFSTTKKYCHLFFDVVKLDFPSCVAHRFITMQI